jgi:CheY-like chemotaxis protein
MKKILKFDRVVLLDDDPVTNLIHERLLSFIDKSLPIHIFTDAILALEYFKSIPLQGKTLLLLDLNMPVTNGWDFLESYRQLDISIKEKIEIYMVTSSVMIGDRQKAMTYPEISGYFTKPIGRLSLELKIIETINEKVDSSTLQGYNER